MRKIAAVAAIVSLGGGVWADCAQWATDCIDNSGDAWKDFLPLLGYGLTAIGLLAFIKLYLGRGKWPRRDLDA